MKTSFIKISSIGLVSSILIAAGTCPLAAGGDARSVTTDQPPADDYTVVERGPDHRVWAHVTSESGPGGKIMARTNSYVELATGMYYQQGGRWVETRETIAVLPDGTAAATRGRHQAYFPGDIQQGEIRLVTPDGKLLRSRPAGLSYYDGQNSVLIAELKDSIGELVGSNQVIYPDAFTDFKADLRYTYTRAGFEQDVILREQPPTPESFGLDPETTRLQVLTEFFNPPPPKVLSRTKATRVGDSEDDTLSFGTMRMGRGKAFLLGPNSEPVAVNKQWLQLKGRCFLVEEIPVASLTSSMDTLPQATPQAGSGTVKHIVSKNLILPPQRLARTEAGSLLLARASLPAQGLVLDYQIINSNTNNFTFQGDTTYYISGPVILGGTTTFEGGAVLKYGSSGGLNPMSLYPQNYASLTVNWQATAYRPVIFTSMNDNSVGEKIGGSTGNPSTYLGPALTFFAIYPPTLANFRIAYAQKAIECENCNLSIYSAQFVNCGIGIYGGGLAVNLRNVLFANVGTVFSDAFRMYIDAQNSTFSGSSSLCLGPQYMTGSTCKLTNCILANVTALVTGNTGAFTLGGDHNGFYASPSMGNNAYTTFTPPFQTAGAGNYYLASGCTFTNAGTTNIDITLLASLRQKTTQPPILLAGITLSANTNLTPQIPRDQYFTNAPDLGYHYDPLDYLMSNVTLNATLTLSSGVAVGIVAPSNYAVVPLTGAKIVSVGLPQTLNEIVSCQNVQEQASYAPEYGFIALNSGGDPARSFQFQSTEFSVGQGRLGMVFASGYGMGAFQNISFKDCRLREAYVEGNLIPSGSPTIGLMNNLILRGRVLFSWYYFNGGSVAISCYNNLFQGGDLSLTYQAGGSGFPNWIVKDNLFDRATQGINVDSYGSSLLLVSNNGFTAGTINSLGGNNNQTGMQPDYQTGPLGNYYYPTNGGNLSRLIDVGSRTADQAGLYAYTTATNQTPEQYSPVDIGFHYPAGSAGDSTGTDFWLAWPNVYQSPYYGTYCCACIGSASIPGMRLIINSGLPASGTISVPGLVALGFGLSQSFTVTPGMPTILNLNSWGWDSVPDTEYPDYVNNDNCAQIFESGTNQPKGIHIVTDQPVSVVEDDNNNLETVAWLCYPTSMLGTNYYVMSHMPEPNGYSRSEFAIVSTANNTHVTITGSPSANLQILVYWPIFPQWNPTRQGPEPAASPTNITLQAGETFQLWSDGGANDDVTGTHITSDQPIMVLAGNDSVFVPHNTESRNPLMQQMLPVESWGRQVFGFPLGTRGNGDTYRVLAAYDGTDVYVNGTKMTTLSAGGSCEFITNGMVEFRGNQPIQVAQFANGLAFDHPNWASEGNMILGDPTMMLLTPAGRFRSTYIISTPHSPNTPCDDWAAPYGTNFLNLIVEQSAITTTYVNGQPVSGFRPIGGSGFYGAQVPIMDTNGVPFVVSSSKPLGVQVYGFAQWDAFGHMGGLNTAPLAAVADAFNTGGAGTAVDVLTNDIYANRANVRVSILAQPAHGAAVVNADKTITYTPNTGSGNDSFIYQIVENGNTNAAPVTMWINNSNPVANNVAVTTPNGTPVVINVLNNDTDPDGDPVSILTVGSASNGTVWFNPTSNALTYTFTNPSATSDSFSYTITDGRGGTATANVTVTTP